MADQTDRTQQIRQAHAGLIHRVVAGCHDRSQVPDLDSALEQARTNGWTDLVAAIERILAGERGEGVLAGLDEEDTVIIRTILQGIQDPGTLPDPEAGPDPAQAAPGLASVIHAAARGQEDALHWAAQMAAQMQQAGGDMARLAAVVRPMINGERDPAVLAEGMDESGRRLVDGILAELERLEQTH